MMNLSVYEDAYQPGKSKHFGTLGSFSLRLRRWQRLLLKPCITFSSLRICCKHRSSHLSVFIPNYMSVLG
ncbi:hypothetical protein HanRHA438_Chr17g0809981 [Helianthus annuus]|nr:hypothetical protein HanIR_Chr17g0867511 [Helianthus annuus]KAJ0826057.1 hypothetical protein HanRHA438_Chr17g0809981 [Helianthus annuus]